MRLVGRPLGLFGKVEPQARRFVIHGDGLERSIGLCEAR
jgi:hypothetical protein